MRALLLLLLSGLIGRSPAIVRCPAQSFQPMVAITAEELAQISRGQPPVEARAPLQAVEFGLPSGVRVQVTSSGVVTEIRGEQSRQIALRADRRAALERTFRAFEAAPVEAAGWLSYVPPGLVETLTRTQRAGKWSEGPAYRNCSTTTADHCGWVTHRTNAFIDEVARLAGYPEPFRCPR